MQEKRFEGNAKGKTYDEEEGFCRENSTKKVVLRFFYVSVSGEILKKSVCKKPCAARCALNGQQAVKDPSKLKEILQEWKVPVWG